MSDHGPKIVQREASEGARRTVHHRPWKWTRARRQALTWMMRGHTDVSIAGKLDVHRNTLRLWRGRAEFQQELAARVAENRTRMRFRRATEVGLFLDALATRIAGLLARLRGGEGLTSRDVAESKALVACYVNARSVERIELQLVDATAEDLAEADKDVAAVAEMLALLEEQMHVR